MKACTKCLKVLPKTSFFERKDGYLSSKCKNCHKEHGREWYRKNRETRLKRMSAWSKSDAGKKSQIERGERQRASGKRSDYEGKRRQNLCNGYIKTALEQRGFSRDQITPDLIAAERALIKLKRAVKEIES